ncbi:hypothetical protein CN285_28225 [Bacillus cereus]|uniref:esterase/lipase family protein n=1 Tax=Bacillus paramycoides TaxID=2026194 RepID=UPI000BF928C7|nr:hypothetical protein [Bacillus paramycoides]PFD31308.1 hypothetical protein CN285_28225 [Bacillus cereus]
MESLGFGLHKISSRNENKAIVFVHGLNGDFIKTWQKKDEKPLPHLMDEDEKFSCFEIYTFGYRTGFILKQYNINQIAQLLRTFVINRLKSKDLYFIVHSLGGIVTQKMLIDLVDSGDNELFDRIKGIIYMAVPFEGAKGGTIVSAVGSLVPPILGNCFFSVQVLSLKVFSDELLDIKNRWKGILDQNRFPKLNQRALRGEYDGTVDPFSSTPGFMDIKHVYGVHANHRNICKIDRNHEVYSLIEGFLNVFLKGDDIERSQIHKNYAPLSFLSKEIDNIVYQLRRVRRNRESLIKDKVSSDIAGKYEQLYKEYDEDGYVDACFKMEDPYCLYSDSDNISYLVNVESYELSPINNQLHTYINVLEDERLKGKLLEKLREYSFFQQSISKDLIPSIYKTGVLKETISKSDQNSFQTKLDQAELRKLEKENSNLYTDKKASWKRIIDERLEFEFFEMSGEIKKIITPLI